MLGHIPMYTTLPVKDLNEAKDFYGNVLGLHVIDQNEHGVWFQTGLTRFAIYESPYAGTNEATAAIWEVVDPEGTVGSLKSRGITFEQYPDMPGVTIEGDLHIVKGLKAAWFKDPSGNIICVGSHL